MSAQVGEVGIDYLVAGVVGFGAAQVQVHVVVEAGGHFTEVVRDKGGEVLQQPAVPAH